MAGEYRDLHNQDQNKWLTQWKSKRNEDHLEGVTFEDFVKFMDFASSAKNEDIDVSIPIPDPDNPDEKKFVRIRRKKWRPKDARQWLDMQKRGKAETAKLKDDIKKAPPKTILVKKQKKDITGDAKPDVEVETKVTELPPPPPMTDYDKDTFKSRLGKDPLNTSDEDAFNEAMEKQKRLLEGIERMRKMGLA